MKIEKVILSHLIYNEKFGQKTIAFLQPEYFHDHEERTVFEVIRNFTFKYRKFPSKEAVIIDITNTPKINGHKIDDDTAHAAIKIVNELKFDEDSSLDWLVFETEKFCKDTALYNAIMRCMNIYDGEEEKTDHGIMSKIISDALAVSFDSHIGHDFIEDSDEWYEWYHEKKKKYSTGLEMLDKITHGGVEDGTLNVAMGGPGIGKSLFLCCLAAHDLMQGHNVLYITAEMSEKKIAERIYVNLYNLDFEGIKKLDKMSFNEKMAKIRKRTTGKLIIKEYPTCTANDTHFRHLINELKLKKKFTPDIIYIDYINICASSRYKAGNVNSYTMIKAISEELRSLAQEMNLPIWTATQTNRTGAGSSDPDMGDVSDSFGLPMTADFMIALVRDETLDELDQIMVKQLGKNRYGSTDYYKRFIIGVDRSRMKLYDVEQSGQIVSEHKEEKQQADKKKKFEKFQ